jgi:hypothetical protein
MRRNCLLKYVIKGRIKVIGKEEEDVRSYWMTLRKRENTEI